MAFVCFCGVAVNEAVLGLRQIFGHEQSGHYLFAMTGSFRNPGPYGGFIAIMAAVTTVYTARHWKGFALLIHSFQSISRHGKNASRCIYWTVFRAVPLILGIAASALCIVVLPASMSRSAWLAFAVAMTVAGISEFGLWKWIRQNSVLAAVSGIAAISIIIGIFFMKKDSALGRLHIWHIELLAMCDSPWHGTGSGTVLGTYGNRQAEYFAEKERSGTEIRVAGCPEYAFNEYFRIGIEHGIPAMLATVAVLIAAIIFMLKIKSVFAYGLTAFAVFAFFSYPLSALAESGHSDEEWRDVKYLSATEQYDEAAEEYGKLYGKWHSDYRFMYEYGYALHKAGRYSQSNAILAEGAGISSDPMFHNIMGKNYEALGEFCRAEEEYLLAHYMVPCRIYPLVLLMEMKAGLGRHEEAAEIGRRILDMPVNRKNRTMAGLVERARATLLSMEPLMLD
ncbi:MAG: O-antigen ligase family protein [Bacteroidales bacterium]|nr:O-antigen ligase family protein [Bacteroidales bacterium]